jgi:hypothetical protein
VIRPSPNLRLVHDVQRANGLRSGLPGTLLDLIGPANSSNPGFLAHVWEQGLLRIVRGPAPEVPHVKALAPVADASALTVVRNTEPAGIRQHDPGNHSGPAPAPVTWRSTPSAAPGHCRSG